MYSFQNPKYFYRVVILAIIALAYCAMPSDSDLEKCKKRMSEEVCMHTLYP